MLKNNPFWHNFFFQLNIKTCGFQENNWFNLLCKYIFYSMTSRTYLAFLFLKILTVRIFRKCVCTINLQNTHRLWFIFFFYIPNLIFILTQKSATVWMNFSPLLLLSWKNRTNIEKNVSFWTPTGLLI